jgi:hypothetical protein
MDETFRGSFVSIPRIRDFNAIDITDKYSLQQRLSCKRVHGPSPWEQWKQHPKWTLCDLQRNVKVCNLYPYSAGMEVIRMFQPVRWLDPTAGWGDRLRIAIDSYVEYVGVDSNSSMQPAYKAIIDDLANGNHAKYKVLEGKFQDVPLTGMFDLVFTSPPFYTKELYENMTIWKSVDEFIDEFLRPLFQKSNAHLMPGGHIVLYIEDTEVGKVIPQMKELVAKEFPGLMYEGAFYYQGTSPRPYYVWKKVEKGGRKRASSRKSRRRRTFRTRKQK